jgi:hypothetical protein
MPPKKKATKKGGFLPLLMLPGGLMGLTALMSKMSGSGLVGGNVSGGARSMRRR